MIHNVNMGVGQHRICLDGDRLETCVQRLRCPDCVKRSRNESVLQHKKTVEDFSVRKLRIKNAEELVGFVGASVQLFKVR